MGKTRIHLNFFSPHDSTRLDSRRRRDGERCIPRRDINQLLHEYSSWCRTSFIIIIIIIINEG
eukprot:gene1288-741_t